jgi:hypothetical protein
MSSSSSIEVETDPQHQLLCPLCGYDLRGLIDPRCPECGYRFKWEELRDPALRLHPYLFEHHAERGIRTFFKTLFNSAFRLRRFWRTLFPTQPSFPRRLLRYAIIVAAIGVMPLIAASIYSMYQMDREFRARRSTAAAMLSPTERAEVIAREGSLEAWLDRVLPLFPSRKYFQLRYLNNWWRLGGHFRVSVFALLWPWLTFLSLLIFRASMRRARVRPVHVLRCVIYSGDVALLTAAAATCAWLAYDPWLSRRAVRVEFYGYFGSARGAAWVMIALFVILTWRLWIAFRRYLRFEHAFATAIASQVMIALLTLKFALDYYAAHPY